MTTDDTDIADLFVVYFQVLHVLILAKIASSLSLEYTPSNSNCHLKYIPPVFTSSYSYGIQWEFGDTIYSQVA